MQPLKKKALSDPILVGREIEIEELKRLFDRAIAGEGSTVFISGEAGSGKTRLVTEFLKIAKKKEAIILNGWCLSETAIPYFPFIEAFDSYIAVCEEEYTSSLNHKLKLKSWLSAIDQFGLTKNINIQPQVWKDKIFYAVAEELMFLSARKALILFLDDIHWADSASLSLLHYLARKVRFERILILVTFRSEQIEINTRDTKNLLTMMLLSMDRDNLLNEIKLPNLQNNDVKKIAESMLNGKVDSHLVTMLTADSHGNPLYVVETIRMLYQRKSIFRKKNNEYSFRPDKFEIPRKVRDIIQRRLETLKPLQRKILDIASVIGEKFDPKLVAAVIRNEYSDILIALDDIEKNTLIVHSEGNEFRFEHEKFCELLYQKIPTLLKKEYHLRVAKEMEAINLVDTKFNVSDLAYHFIKSDNKEKAIEFSLKAGKDALSRFSNVEAIDYFSYVIDSTLNNPKLIEKQEFALEGLGDAQVANCMYEEAISTFNQLANSRKEELQLRALRKAMEAAFIKGDKPDILLKYAKKAEELEIKDSLEMGRIIKNRGRAFAWVGRGERKQDLEDYETALKIFEEENSLNDIAEALWRIGELQMLAVDTYQKGLEKLLRSRCIFSELGDVRKEIAVSRSLGNAFVSLGLLNEAKKELNNVIKVGEKIGAFYELARAKGILGFIDEYEGNLKKALSEALEALKYIKKTDVNYVLAYTLGGLTRLYSKLGNLKLANKYFRKIMELPPEVLSIGIASFHIRMAKAVYLTAKGRYSESIQIFEELPSTIMDLLENSPFIDEYIAALEKQGKTEKVKSVKERAQKKNKENKKWLRNANVKMSLQAPRNVLTGEIFEIRLDLVNLSTDVRTLIKAEGLLVSGCEIISIPSFCSVQNNAINFNNRLINPFHVETIKIKMSCVSAGVFEFKSHLHYTTEARENRFDESKPFTVTVHPNSNEMKKLPISSLNEKFKNASTYTKKVFDYLTKAFVNDYQIQKIPKNRSGWRTLMEIVLNANVSKYSMYGRSGKGGKVIAELVNLGIVELKYFIGERGRGGRILKMRISNQNELESD